MSAAKIRITLSKSFSYRRKYDEKQEEIRREERNTSKGKNYSLRR